MATSRQLDIDNETVGIAPRSGAIFLDVETFLSCTVSSFFCMCCLSVWDGAKVPFSDL